MKTKFQKTPILILHGWATGGKGTKYDAIRESFEKKGHKVYLPDLPGFGSNTLKKDEFFFEDYVLFVKDTILSITKTTEKKKVILLGHSFGGRIAIRVSSLYPELVEKLILTGASGIPRPLPSLKKKLVYVVTKITKPIFLLPPMAVFYKFFRKLIYYSIGEMDYYKAGSLAQTFKNTYKVSIAGDLEKIHLPTLIVWGEKDTITPLIDGKYMHAHIAKSELVVVPNATHKLPYEEPDEFSRIVLEFINKI